MTILVCGAGGQVGRELCERANPCVIALDRRELDITNRERVIESLHDISPSVVINAAAYTAVDKAEQDPSSAYSINRDGAENLAIACRQMGIPLLHLSTDYVFDGYQKGRYRETDPVNPLGVYARSKCDGEQRVREILPRHIILRVSWVFGVHGSNFVKTILRLSKDRSELRIIDDQHGCPTHAGAIADALLSLAEKVRLGGELDWGTYHYTGAPATTWYGFALAILQRAKALGMIMQEPVVFPISTAEYPLPAPRPTNSLLDCSAAEKNLGLHCQDWENGLDQVMRSLALQRPDN